MAKKVPLLPNEYYHLYNRGTDKRVIFNDKDDYQRFMVLLYLCNSYNPVILKDLFSQGLTLGELYDLERGDTLVDIAAHTLMPNHFHLFIYEHTYGGASKFMQKLATAYTMYFNAKNKRTGGLFEGSFRARHVDSEPYFNYVFSYVHINPVKLIEPKWKEVGIKNPVAAEKYLKRYPYSSFRDYFVGDRPEGVILNKESFAEHFSSMRDFGTLIDNWWMHEKSSETVA